MAKVTFYCNSGAEGGDTRIEELDTVEDLGLEEGEWEEMSEEERYFIVDEWANERLEIWYEEED